MSVSTPDTIGGIVDVRPDATEAPFLNAPVDVQAVADGTTTHYYATWPSLDLDGEGLHQLLDIASPQPGVEDRQEVVQNYRGIHEYANRSIIKVHRRLFGEKWIDMAHSRRLLWTVIGGEAVQRLSYDDSVFYNYRHIQPETITDRDLALTSIDLHATLVDTLERIKRPYRGDDEEVEKATAGFTNILESMWEKMRNDELSDRHFISRYDLLANHDLAREFRAIVDQSIAEATDDEVAAMLAYAYNTFVDDEDVTHYVSRSTRPEENISLQAMYHQRLPIELYDDYSDRYGFQRWFESFSGIDHTHFTKIKGTPFEIPGYGVGHTVRPVLAWSKDADGERRHIRNPDLPKHLWTRDEGEKGIHYTDTTTGLVMAALALPEIREGWQKTATLPKDMVKKDEYRITPGELEIDMGAAQTPLLTLLSGEAIRSSVLIERLEQIAERTA